MKKILLLILLTLVMGINNLYALHPNNVVVYQTATINSSQVSETASHFVHKIKIPRTGLVANTCRSAEDVVIYNQVDSVRYKSWINYTTDTLFCYIDAGKSTTTNSVVTIGFGPSLSEPNDSTAFVGNGVIHYYGMNATTGTTIEDYAGAIDGTLISPTALTSGGQYGYYAKCNSTGDITYGKPTVLSSTQHFSISMLVNFSAIGGGTERNLFYQGSSNSNRIIINTTSTGNLVFDISNGSNSYGYISISALQLSSWHYIACVFDGLQTTNGSRLQTYIDGVQQTLTFSGTIPNTTPNVSASTAETGVITTGSPEGVDELSISNVSVSANTISDMYKMIFTPSTFYTLSEASMKDTLASTSFYVSVDGNDANSGSISSPFKTIDTAIARCRMLAYDTIYLRDGIYKDTRINIPLSKSSIVIKNYQNESPIISGGYYVAGNWEIKDTTNNIWKRHIPHEINTREIYYEKNGLTTRCVRSKTGLSKYGTHWKCDSIGVYDSTNSLSTWNNYKYIEAVWLSWFFEDRSIVDTVETFNTTGALIKFKEPVWKLLTNKYNSINRYAYPKPYFENCYDFIDSIGEWYLDKVKDTLFYKPRTSENLLTDTMVIAMAETLLVANADNVKISGLTFKYGTWLRPNDRGLMVACGGIQLYDSIVGGDVKNASWGGQCYWVPANVVFKASNGVSIKNCNFSFTGGPSSIEFDTTCNYDTVSYCSFNNVNGTTITLTPTNTAFKNTFPRSKKISITYNTILNPSETYRSMAGVDISRLDSAEILHNTIKNTPWNGMHCGEAARNTEIAYNRMEKNCELLYDGGSIYMTGPSYKTIVHDNYIGPSKLWMSSGIYFDNGNGYQACNYRMYNNVFDHSTYWSSPSGQYNDTVLYNFVNNASKWKVDTVAFPNLIRYNELDLTAWPDTAIKIIERSGSNPYTYSKSTNNRWPGGTKYVIPITVDASFGLCISTDTFLFQAKIIDTAFTSKDSCLIYDAVQHKVIKKTIYNIGDTLFVDWTGTTKTPLINRYFLCKGKFTNKDSVSLYSNANIVNRFSFDDSLASDRTGTSTSTITGALVGVDGIVGKCTNLNANTSKIVTTANFPINQYTLDFLFYYDSLSAINGGGIISDYGTVGTRALVWEADRNNFRYACEGYTTTYNEYGTVMPGYSDPEVFLNKRWQHVSVSRKTDTTKVYINGYIKMIIIGNPSSGINSHFTFGGISNSDSYSNKIDEATLRNVYSDSSFVASRYNMIRPTSIMIMQRDGFSVSTSTGTGWGNFLRNIGFGRGH